MTRAELALWDRAYRIADAGRVGFHPFHSERDPLAQHLMAEAIVNLAGSATKARTLSPESERSATTDAAPKETR